MTGDPIWVDSDSVRLAAYESGDPDGPCVLLMHGLTSTHDYVLMRNRRFERAGYRVVSYDARGHGRSTRPAADDAYEYTDLVVDLEAAIAAFEIDRALLVGASMGGHTALRYALAEPAKVDGIAFITPAYHPVRSFLPETLARWDSLTESLAASGIDGFVEAYRHPLGEYETFDAVMRLLRKRLLLHEDIGGVVDALRVVPRSRPYAAIEDVSAFAQPALVVGSRDDFDVEHPLAVAEEHAAALGSPLIVEEPGSFPTAWIGARVTRVIHEFARDAVGLRGRAESGELQPS